MQFQIALGIISKAELTRHMSELQEGFDNSDPSTLLKRDSNTGVFL